MTLLYPTQKRKLCSSSHESSTQGNGKVKRSRRIPDNVWSVNQNGLQQFVVAPDNFSFDQSQDMMNVNRCLGHVPYSTDNAVVFDGIERKSNCTTCPYCRNSLDSSCLVCSHYKFGLASCPIIRGTCGHWIHRCCALRIPPHGKCPHCCTIGAFSNITDLPRRVIR